MVDTNFLCVTVLKLLSTAPVRTPRHYFSFFYLSKVFSQGRYGICSRLDRGDAVSDKNGESARQPSSTGIERAGDVSDVTRDCYRILPLGTVMVMIFQAQMPPKLRNPPPMGLLGPVFSRLRVISASRDS